MGLKLAGVMMIIMGVVGGIFYWYYTDTQEKMAIMHENNAKLETAMQTQKQAIDQYQKDIKLVTASKLEVEEQFAKSRESVQELKNKFNKVSKLLGARDLGKMGAAKPRSIQRIVNKGSKDVLRCFEIASGKPLTEKEKDAIKPSQINKQCPNLANPNHIKP
tara:strand:- start:1099 stop:1584 length:486 start_codon:yes stop_codon:yes gene_type:complete